MKSLKLRAISLTMAFAVLFSSTGFAMYVHTCNFTQKKSYSLTSEDACCESDAAESGTTISKTKCCSITKSLNKVAANQALFVTLGLAGTSVLFSQEFQQFFFQAIVVVRDHTVNLFANPPPVSGKLFLAFIQSYLI